MFSLCGNRNAWYIDVAILYCFYSLFLFGSLRLSLRRGVHQPPVNYIIMKENIAHLHLHMYYQVNLSPLQLAVTVFTKQFKRLHPCCSNSIRNIKYSVSSTKTLFLY